MYKGKCNIQGLQKRGAAGDKQPAGSGGGLEALCRSAGEKSQGYIQACCRLTSGRDGTGVGGNR